LSGGEGGFVLTNSDHVKHRLLLAMHYNKRCKAEIPETNPLYKYASTGWGLKARIHPFAAALALRQLGLAPGLVAKRQVVADYLKEHLGSLPGLTSPESHKNSVPSWYAFILQFDGAQLGGLTVEKFVEEVKAEGAGISHPSSMRLILDHPLFTDPGDMHPGYSRCPVLTNRRIQTEKEFPVAKAFFSGAVKLPVWHCDIREDDPEYKTMQKWVTAIKKVVVRHTSQ
jgi:dTDP-4-amino-4,6-dideoxygalactose transaminase